MHPAGRTLAAASLCAIALAGCASRPVNPRLDAVEPGVGYRTGGRENRGVASDTLVVLAFSGGGTRAAAFSYGVLEELRRTELSIGGKKTRMIDEVDTVTGVSGGSFTALSFALYGEALFDEFEPRFLKRDVQGELASRILNPFHWPSLASAGWGRSEIAAEYYDEILFRGATFGDLVGKPGPIAIATATDLSTGSRISFVQGNFDVICSNLAKFPLSRAAAASSAVPVVLSPVTIDNYGGRCGYRPPPWIASADESANRSRPAGRALQRFRELASLQDSAERPYLHLVDGGVSDNLGMRSVLEGLEQIEASAAYRQASRIDRARRMAVFVVNSKSEPKTDWDRHERPPSDIAILIKATGVPIDRYSYETVELLKDTIARWKAYRALRASAPGAVVAEVPDIELYAIDVSFAAHPDPVERDYLNTMPTSFVLPAEQVDRLRAAAGAIVRQSPEFRRLLADLAASPPAPPRPAAAPR